MTRILLVKTSSLGDVVHNLPVVTDLRRHRPEARIDWAVEEAFADIPRLHPGVDRVIPVRARRWMRRPFSPGTWREVGRLRALLGECRHDQVIDTQGLLKSALVASFARGCRHGLDFSSAREPLACFYDAVHRVPWSVHAVERNRMLAASALGYAIAEGADYGITAPRAAAAWLPERPYAVLLHATSADRKLWSEANWSALIRWWGGRGVACVLPWGSERERLRSERIASAASSAVVPPRLAIREVASLLAGAVAAAGVDTGFLHLAAALGVPVAGIYVATDPAATGVHACARSRNVGGIGRSPPLEAVIGALEELVPA